MQLRMAVHSARQCLLRKKSGLLCKRKDCLARQIVLECFFKSCARRVLVIGVDSKKQFIYSNQSQLATFSCEESTHNVSLRGRPRKQASEPLKRFTSNAKLPLRKPFRTNVCGGGPKQQIDIKRYVETLKLT